MQIINPLEISNWNDLILKHKNYSFFHTQEWADVIAKSYGYEPLYFTIYSGTEILAGIPSFYIKSYLTGNRLVSLPFSDFCEPIFLSVNDAEEIKKFIIDFAKRQKLKYVEFRSSDTKFPFDAQEYMTDLRHILFLNKKEDELFKAFSENNRRNIKKASKSNVKVDVHNNTNGLNAFYDMFCVTRKKHGLPPQPFSFFQNIFDIIIQPGLGDIILAEHDNKFIAGAVYFKVGKKVLYKYGASYPEFNDLRGNNAVMWFAIKKYLNEKYEEFDFGKTEALHEGLRKFKLGWNTVEKFIFTTHFDLDKGEYLSVSTKTEGFHNKIFVNLPIQALKLIGGLLYKHIG